MGLNATFNNNSNLNARFSVATTFGASIDSTVYVPVLEEYEGPYTVTPSEDTQTLGTEGFHMARDVNASVTVSLGNTTVTTMSSTSTEVLETNGTFLTNDITIALS